MFVSRIKNNLLRNILEWAISIAIALLVFLLIDNFVVKSARVDGASMEPTYSHNDRVVINRFIYIFTDPQLGDVIAFPYATNPSMHYIKRIVGIPGDIMDIHDGYIYRNGERLDDPFVNRQVFPVTADFPVVVEYGTFFVLGDNRRNSEDSRHAEVGNIPLDDIIGRVNFRWFPFDRFGFVE
ncbi:MAG: signal peptidase I [Defluviitaleaceae bacterium]|nr:signal peptidase I [Defluviitaleaceae bacterium]